MSEPVTPVSSLWESTATRSSRSLLVGEERADVVIVGAGMAGLCTAWHLVRAGRSVVVLDQSGIGAGMTAKTTAHLTAALDDQYVHIEQAHGRDGSRIAAESHTKAIAAIESVVAELEIDCGFERIPGYLFCPPGGRKDFLAEELAAVHRAGLRQVQIVERAPLPSWDTGIALHYPDQGQMHPLHFLEGLARGIQDKGGRIFKAHVREVHDDPQEPHVVTDQGIHIRGKAIVIATNSPIHQNANIHTKMAPYMSYVVAMPVPKDSVPAMLLWDTAQTAKLQEERPPVPYHYVRIQRGSDTDYVIVGGEDHKTGLAHDGSDRFERLAAWTRERFPSAGPPAWRWSGEVFEPLDHMAFIGRSPGEKNVLIATGDSGNGMTHGMIAGLLLSELAVGGSHPWAALYDPARLTVVRTPKEYLIRNLDAAARFKDYVAPGDVGRKQAVLPGTGAIVREGLSILAVYVDAAGNRQTMSAVCPHMKCIVHWNQSERTWDCPCHGSRFGATGEVLMGPAREGLKKIEDG